MGGGGNGVGRYFGLGWNVKTTFAAPTAQQCVKNRSGPDPLSVVAIPDHVTAGMNQCGGRVFRHFPGGFTNEVRFDGGDWVSPFGSVCLDRLLQFVEAGGVFLSIIFIIEVFLDDDMDP